MSSLTVVGVSVIFSQSFIHQSSLAGSSVHHRHSVIISGRHSPYFRHRYFNCTSFIAKLPFVTTLRHLVKNVYKVNCSGGHIESISPVCHSWFTNSQPACLSLSLPQSLNIISLILSQYGTMSLRSAAPKVTQHSWLG